MADTRAHLPFTVRCCDGFEDGQRRVFRLALDALKPLPNDRDVKGLRKHREDNDHKPVGWANHGAPILRSVLQGGKTGARRK